MEYTEVLKELKKLREEERSYIVYKLLLDKSISYTQLSKIYVKTLEEQRDTDTDIKCELGVCLVSDLIYQESRKTKSVVSDHSKWIHRVIAILDIIGMFQLDSMKERYKYDVTIGKSGTFWDSYKK